MGGMDETPKRRAFGRPASLAAVVAVALPVVYVLSAGPARWLNEKGYIGDHVINTLYLPTVWLMNSHPTMGQLVRWYLRLWGP